MYTIGIDYPKIRRSAITSTPTTNCSTTTADAARTTGWSASSTCGATGTEN